MSVWGQNVCGADAAMGACEVGVRVVGSQDEYNASELVKGAMVWYDQLEQLG